WPLRDALNELRREEMPFVCDGTRVYLRDCYDHAVQLIDLVESYRDIAGDVRDFFMSTISNRMNEVMKTLTMIATICMPMSIVAGIYGMNFERDPTPSRWNMPELGWKYGYFFALAVMAVVGIAMYGFFRWRGYLASDPSHLEHEHEHEHAFHASGGERQ